MNVKTSEKSKVYNITLCGMFAALIAVGAFIKIPVPVVPFTLQFLFTNLAGLALGKKWGFISVMIYILVGLAGVPVFAEGGGIGYVLKPSFGYIIGFAAGAWIAGLIAEKYNEKTIGMFMAGFTNLLTVYAMGMIYYYFVSRYYVGNPIGVKTLIIYCFLLAVPGDIALCILSSSIAKTIRKQIKRN